MSARCNIATRFTTCLTRLLRYIRSPTVFSLRELRFLVASHFQPDRPVEQREELSDEVVRGMLWVRRLARIIQVALRYMYQ